jgi:hypothetical protein
MQKEPDSSVAGLRAMLTDKFHMFPQLPQTDTGYYIQIGHGCNFKF